MTPEAGVPELDGAPLFLLDELPEARRAAGRRRRGPARGRRPAAGRRASRCGSATARRAWPRASVLAAGADGLRVAVRARARGARAGAASSCWCRRCPRATAGRWPSSWPPSSASTGSCRGRRRAASPGGGRTAVDKALAKWRAGRAGGQQAVPPAAGARGDRADDHPRRLRRCSPTPTSRWCCTSRPAVRSPDWSIPPAAAPWSSSSGPRVASPTARWSRSAPPARRPCGWAPRCCARRPPAPPRSPRSRCGPAGDDSCVLRTAPRQVPSAARPVVRDDAWRTLGAPAALGSLP